MPKKIHIRKNGAIYGGNMLESRVKKIIADSDSAYPLFAVPSENNYLLVLLTRTPSKTPQGTGYCGAGYEDKIILLKFNGKNIKYSDELNLQSCLKNILLDSDKGDNPINAIAIDDAAKTITYRLLSDPAESAHTISIVNNKIQNNKVHQAQ